MTRTVWRVGWGFTSACNLSCPFCYSRSARSEPAETPLAVAKAFVRRNAGEIASINFGTGESTLSAAWFELIDFIRSEFPALRLALTTNGTLAETGDLFSRRALWAGALDEVDVSIDFADPALHNLFRGNPEAHSRALRCLELCTEQNIVTTIVMVGFAESLRPANLEGLLRLAERYGAFLRINILRPTPEVSVPPPSPEQVYEALGWLLGNAAVVSLCDPLIGTLCDPQFRRDGTNGEASLRILPDGSITPSPYLITEEWKGASMRRGDLSLSELSASSPFVRIAQAPVPAECGSCRYARSCRGGAADRRFLHFGTLERRDPYCPFRSGCAPSLPPLRRHAGVDAVPTVHDGYLPTLIFAV